MWISEFIIYLWIRLITEITPIRKWISTTLLQQCSWTWWTAGSICIHNAKMLLNEWLIRWRMTIEWVDLRYFKRKPFNHAWKDVLRFIDRCRCSLLSWTQNHQLKVKMEPLSNWLINLIDWIAPTDWLINWLIEMVQPTMYNVVSNVIINWYLHSCWLSYINYILFYYLRPSNSASYFLP